MKNTAIDNKNHQPNLLSQKKFPNDGSGAGDRRSSSLSGSEGQKREKITLIIKGDERRPGYDDEILSSSSSKDEKENTRLKSPKKEFEKESADDKFERSSGFHLIYNSDNHHKPTIDIPVAYERYNNNEKQNNPSEGQIEERGIRDLNASKSPNEKRFRSNNSNNPIYSASIVQRDFDESDENGRVHHVSKNYMRLKVPKSPKTPNSNNYIASREAEITPEYEDNTPTSNRKKFKKKVSKNKQEKPQLSISKERYDRTPATIEGPERRKVKRKKNNNEYIPSDYRPQASPSPNYYPYNFMNFNNNPPYIELEIVPEEDSVIDEDYPRRDSGYGRSKQRSTPRYDQRSPRYEDRSPRHEQRSTPRYEQKSPSTREQRIPTPKRERKPTQTVDQGIPTHEQMPTPTREQVPTPTQNVGTETKLLRNSSSTQTSFIQNSRPTKSTETSLISRNRNQNQNQIPDNNYNQNNNDENDEEEDTNENVFNSPKSPNNNRNRSAAYENPPGSPSSPHTFNVPRSPHSPRSTPPTYKSDADGLTNSARKSQKEPSIFTRNANLETNSNEVSVNHVPVSTDEEDGNQQNELSISSLEKKINQIKPQKTNNRNAELDEESDSQKRQQRKPSQHSSQIQSPKYLSESNSGSVHGDSSANKNNDESYEECVLNPSRGSSIIQNSRSRSQSHPHSQLSESQEESQHSLEVEEEEEIEKKESSHMSAKSNHSKTLSRQVSAENSSLKGKNSHVSSSHNLKVPSQNNSITTESTKQPSLINEGSSKRGTGGSSKVSFNSNMSHTSNKQPSNASKSTISIESEVQDFITPDKKSTSSKKPNSKQSSLLSQHSAVSEKSHHSKIASSINSPHNSNLGSSIHSPYNSKVGSSIHSVHNSNGSNSIVSEASLHQNPSLISNNSASTFLGDKNVNQNQFSEAFDHLSEFTTSDPSDRFIKKRGLELDSVIDSEISNNSAISIESNASDKKSREGSVLVEEIEEDEIEEEITDSQATKGESDFSNLFDNVSNNTNDQSSSFDLFEGSSMKSRRVNKRFIDPSEQYIKLGLQVLEVKTRDPRVNEIENEIPPLSNSIHEVQIEPAVPTESKPLFVQIGFKDQDTILSTPTKNCQKLEDPISDDEAFSTSWNSNFLVTGFENSAILFTLCRTEFSGFKKLASASIPLYTFNDINDGWFDLMPENEDDEMSRSAPNSPTSPRSSVYGKIHIVTNVESKITLPPFDIEKQVEIIASRDQIKLDNRNQEEIERIRAIDLDLSSTADHSSSIHEDDDFNVQQKKLSKKFSNFRNQFSSVSDVSAAYMNSENNKSEGHRIRHRKISANSSKNSLQADDNKLNSSSSLSRRRKKENDKEHSLSNFDSNSFNSASSSTRRRIKVPKNQNQNNEKVESDLSDLNDFSTHSSHGSSTRSKNRDKKLSSASEGNDFQFEKASPSNEKQNKTNQSEVKNSELDNFLKDISTTPETITFDNSSTVVGTSNFTLSGLQSPLKTNQNKLNQQKIEEEEENSDDIHPLSVFSSETNSDALLNSIDFAEVKKEKTSSRDPPKRTHVSSSHNKDDNDSF